MGTYDRNTWAVLAPNLAPLRGCCPVCGEVFDDSGCRLLRAWDVSGGPVVRAYEVSCTGEPPRSETLPGWFLKLFDITSEDVIMAELLSHAERERIERYYDEHPEVFERDLFAAIGADGPTCTSIVRSPEDEK